MCEAQFFFVFWGKCIPGVYVFFFRGTCFFIRGRQAKYENVLPWGGNLLVSFSGTSITKWLTLQKKSLLSLSFVSWLLYKETGWLPIKCYRWMGLSCEKVDNWPQVPEHITGYNIPLQKVSLLRRWKPKGISMWAQDMCDRSSMQNNQPTKGRVRLCIPAIILPCLKGYIKFQFVLRETPSRASIPPYQNGTMAKDDCWVGKVYWRRGRALDQTGERVVCFGV